MFHALIAQSTVFDKTDSAPVGWATAAGSTTTVVNLTTTYTGNPDGKEFILINGNVAGRGSVILSHTTDGSGYVNSVTLADPLPQAPNSGARFMFVGKRTTGSYVSGTTGFFFRIQELTFNSVINGGFDRADIKGIASSNRAIPADDIVGAQVDIFDDGGFWVWSGIVKDVVSSGDSLSLSCVGYHETYSWYEYNVDWAQDGNTTSKNVLADIVKSNPWVENSYAQIDPDNSIHNAQSSAGGIGPLEWSDDSPTAKEAIRDIEKIGAMPLAPNPVLFQQWGRAGAVLHEFDYWNVSPKWVLSRRDMSGFDFTQLDVSVGMGGNYTRTYVKYTDGGEALQTAYIYRPHDYVRIGKKEKGFSYGDTTRGVADMMAEVLAAPRWMNFVGGRITVGSRRISAYRGSVSPIPAYAVRPGDVIDVASALKVGSGLGSKFVVGEVRVRWPLLSVEFTAYSPVFAQDILAQYLEVD